MADSPKTYDVWFVQTNTVYKQVPYHAVSDWVQQGRLGPDDKLKATGSAQWMPVSAVSLFQPYLPQPEPQRVGDAAEALEPIELDFNWKRRAEDDDDDVDMIPLIDISLVLLIFFMMTTTIASVSRIKVPSMANAVKIDTNREVLRIDIDLLNGKPVYAVGRATADPKEGDSDLQNIPALAGRIDAALKDYQEPPRVRIAAHGDLPYEEVERVMKELDRLGKQGLIGEYYIEVNERAAR